MTDLQVSLVPLDFFSLFVFFAQNFSFPTGSTIVDRPRRRNLMVPLQKSSFRLLSCKKNVNVHAKFRASESILIVLVLLFWFSSIIILQLYYNELRDRVDVDGPKGIATVHNNPALAIGNQEQHQKQDLHLVFSTSCSPSQDWQSYLLYYSAFICNQPGTVTRIVSGCDFDELKALKNMHEVHIKPMSDRFKLHITTGDWLKDVDNDNDLGKGFNTIKYWNKPFGVKDWMEKALGYSYYQTNKDSSSAAETVIFHDNHEFDNSIVILIDPDMILQRPILNDFSDKISDKSSNANAWQLKDHDNMNMLYSKVSHGHPVAQLYYYGTDWRLAYGNLTHVVGADSPVHRLLAEDAFHHYRVGPPYILTAKDMYKVSKYWVDFVPRLSDLTDDFLMEMYGYSLASAHLGLKHQLARGFIASDVRREDWSFLLHNHRENACRPPTTRNSGPYLVHYCNKYGLGEYFFNKYLIPGTDIITSCQNPLMKAPPNDIAVTTNYSKWGNGEIHIWDGNNGNKKEYRYQHAYMICSIIDFINEAATYYRDNHCEKGTANYHKTWMWPHKKAER